MKPSARWLGFSLAMAANCATGAEGVPAPATPAQTPPTVTPGEQAYARHCLTCHQADGYGVPNLQPAIVGGSWVQGEVQALALFVLTGGFNSAERKDGQSHNVMPAFRHLPDQELADILTYIRQKFGKAASAVSAGEIAAARASLPATP